MSSIALTPSEQADRVVAVILNRVQNLTWFYFDVDLQKQFDRDFRTQIPKLRVLSRIDDRGLADLNGRFKWIGTPDEEKDLLGCLLFVLRTNPETGRQLFRRIFDLNDIPASESETGTLGFCNRWVTAQRQTAYRKNIMKPKNRITVVAEGDSWFQYPFPKVPFLFWYIDTVKDIVDHFLADERYRVLSIAAGGDWLSTMLQSGQYVAELSRVQPDVFLFSGGGNDLTSDGRAAFMVREPKKPAVLDAWAKKLNAKRGSDPQPHATFVSTKYEKGLSCLTPEFCALMNLLFLQYLLLIQNLLNEKLENIIVLTHGYDYMLPSGKDSPWIFRLPFRAIENWLVAKRWLWVPMQEKKLEDDEKQAAIYTIVYEFNELMISLAKYSGHPRLFHIDCRGITKKEDDEWYDEIHLNSKAFGKVKAIMDACISAARTGFPKPVAQKVFTEKDVKPK